VTLRQYVVTVAITAAFVASAVPLTAQGTEKFTARLGWVPTAGPNDRVNVTGKGTATGTLSGDRSAPIVVANLDQALPRLLGFASANGSIRKRLQSVAY